VEREKKGLGRGWLGGKGAAGDGGDDGAGSALRDPMS